MAWIAFYIIGSGGLSVSQQQANSDQFYAVMSSYGFSDVACAAIWSNICFESGGNPMAWETGNTTNGFGLVQWTPATKIRDWANSNNLNPDDGNVQCRRIYLEFSDTSTYQQYYQTTNFPVSASQFMNADLSQHDITWWSEAFTRNYERPNEQAFQDRKAAQFAAAQDYYTRFSGEQPPAGSYRITTSVSGNGYVTISPSKAYYDAGDQITVNTVAYTGESLTSLTSSPGVGISTTNKTFTMPDSNVIISAAFTGSGGGGGEPETIDLVLRLVENNNLEVWQDGVYKQFLPNEQNIFKLKIESEGQNT